jgi:hypothetical protein
MAVTRALIYALEQVGHRVELEEWQDKRPYTNFYAQIGG